VIKVLHIFFMLLNTSLCDKIYITMGTALVALDHLARLWYVNLMLRYFLVKFKNVEQKSDFL